MMKIEKLLNLFTKVNSFVLLSKLLQRNKKLLQFVFFILIVLWGVFIRSALVKLPHNKL